MVLTARSIRVDASVGALAEVRSFVRSAAADAGAPAECLEDLVQAVDEAATNTIVHGYDGAPGWIEVGEGHPLEEVAFLRDRSCSRADAPGADDEDLHASAPCSRSSSSTSSGGSPRSTRPSRPVTSGAAQSAFTTASSVASTVAAKSGSRSRPPSSAEPGEVEKATKISPLP